MVRLIKSFQVARLPIRPSIETRVPLPRAPARTRDQTMQNVKRNSISTGEKKVREPEWNVDVDVDVNVNGMVVGKK
ncbi:hypothetical protein N7466_010253 [Penicillium verhagenii]|uniref:uncharacterized protein n=1 Tax=Penicillium verhagenii TaxID=1562060 RepID=UPI0025457E06|nr:uncharacterized protein N7466_010253 [Penicillium verhagenii]KAJ5919310.1 hypothetical protein N7466_010253 [Penicillium verhagenii]